jgi:DNA polymerase-1
VLTHIEANGMYLDYEVVMKHYARYATEAAESKRDLDELTGGINMRSGPQVAHFLYSELKFPEKRDKKGNALRNKPSKQFPDGAPRVDKMTMNWLATKCETPNQREFIALRQQYSKANAALTKNLEFFKGVCEEYAGKFHGQFNQTVASTHRLTASGMPLKFLQFDKDKSVQFQNMPREFKDCFVAPEGYVVVEADAMQLEFRVAAFLGHDKQALADIADPDFDAHIFSASEINGLSYRPLLEDYRRHSSKAKVLRQRAKEHTFKPLYGGTKGTDGEERYYKKFAERYAGIAAEQENWLAEVMATGKLKLPWGMQFTWDVYINSRGLAMNRETNKPVGPQVSNYPVQNLATAEIVPIAIIYLYKACKEAGIDVIFVNTVHDSVICYVKNDEKTIEAFKKIASAAFTSDVYNHLALLYGIDFDVPLGTEMKIGSHWGVGDEFKYDDVVNRRIV